MDLRLYPLDRQVCVLQIASCEYSKMLGRIAELQGRGGCPEVSVTTLTAPISAKVYIFWLKLNLTTQVNLGYTQPHMIGDI